MDTPTNKTKQVHHLTGIPLRRVQASLQFQSPANKEAMTQQVIKSIARVQLPKWTSCTHVQDKEEPNVVCRSHTALQHSRAELWAEPSGWAGPYSQKEGKDFDLAEPRQSKVVISSTYGAKQTFPCPVLMLFSHQGMTTGLLKYINNRASITRSDRHAPMC